MHLKHNFSVKREAIYKTLASAKCHPTAEWVYQQLKPTIPDLSIGTVYRNLTVFKEQGIAKCVAVVNGHERFDADMSPHPHFICNKCFRVLDVPNGRNFADKSTYEYVEEECGVIVNTHNVTFYGICRTCAE